MIHIQGNESLVVWAFFFFLFFDKGTSGNCSQHFTLLFQLCYRRSCDIEEIS